MLTGLSDRERSLVGRHWNAARRYLDYGDDSALAEFDDALLGGIEIPGLLGIPFAGYVLETDLDVIEWHAVRGDVRFESIYHEVQ